MKRPDVYDFAFAALLVIVGFAPLMTVTCWQGYGPHGEFSCTCGQYYVRFSDPTFGGDKPHVFAVYQGFQVDMIEASDKSSTVDGLNLYANFTTAPKVVGGTLDVAYTSPTLNFTKQVTIDGGTLHIDYTFSRNVTADLTFWRGYYATVDGYSQTTTADLNPTDSISFSFLGQAALFNATLTADPAPASAQIAGVEGAGLNKIALVFQGDRADVTITLTKVTPLAGAGVVEVASSNAAFPFIGVAAACLYLGVRWRRRAEK